jgi:TRAP-type mannitol/chloroaromatic compound transport system permease small subunit
MEQLAYRIDQLNDFVGRAAAWLTSALVVLIFVDVISRYFFESTAAWVIDLEWHLFALIFLLGGGYAFRHDKHVRVDLFYSRFSERDQAWVNILGCCLLLIPWCFAIVWVSSAYAYSSFLIREGSPDPGGLTARYLIKFSVVVGFVLLLLQGISVSLKSYLVLRQPKED